MSFTERLIVAISLYISSKLSLTFEIDRKKSLLIAIFRNSI